MHQAEIIFFCRFAAGLRLCKDGHSFNHSDLFFACIILYNAATVSVMVVADCFGLL